MRNLLRAALVIGTLSTPMIASAEAPKTDTAKKDAPKTDTAKKDAPKKADAKKADAKKDAPVAKPVEKKM